MKVDIVIGLGYGDEGKGSTVNALATPDSLVVRFNGGHQAGHNVHHNGIVHTFSSFGSGTLKNSATFISNNCTIDPFALQVEEKMIIDKMDGKRPTLYLDAEVMITTPWDAQWNKSQKYLQNGTVGVGFGATIERNENHCRLYARDLLYEEIYDYKIDQIKDYYSKLLSEEDVRLIDQQWYYEWEKALNNMIKYHTIVESIYDISYDNRKHLIFEGAQGIMLDQRYGFFPHVTRSNTTSQNVWKMLSGFNNLKEITTYYITRGYSTRHGAGPIANDFSLTDQKSANPHEINVDTGIQGKFRTKILDLDTLKYAIRCDQYHNMSEKFKLVITCLDHSLVDNKIAVRNEGDEEPFDLLLEPLALGEALGIHDVIESYSPELKIDQNG